ncbi:hypothetical protein [Streptomyces mayteni]
MKKHRSNHILAAGAALAGVGMAWLMYEGLREYDVPFVLAFCIAVVMGLDTLNSVFNIATRARTITHRCTEPDCTFRVSVTAVDAAESRRWQEIAAAHPHRYRAF